MRGWMNALVLSVSVLALGCGSSNASEKGSRGKVSAVEAMGITPPDSPWDEMSVADKEFYMIGKVNPIFQEVFAAHDAQEYADFDCVDCHGEEMREINFKMPAPSMYVVPPEGTPGHKGMLLTFPEEVKFMQEVVTPYMGTLLGIESYTCAGCHPSEAPKTKKKSRANAPKAGDRAVLEGTERL